LHLIENNSLNPITLTLGNYFVRFADRSSAGSPLYRRKTPDFVCFCCAKIFATIKKTFAQYKLQLLAFTLHSENFGSHGFPLHRNIRN